MRNVLGDVCCSGMSLEKVCLRRGCNLRQLTRMLVVPIPCAPVLGNVKIIEVVSSHPVGGYLVMEETVIGRLRLSSGSM